MAEIERIEFIPGPGLSSDAQRDWQPMVKRPSVVYMRQVDYPFLVHTNEGILWGEPGDWVAHDPQSGHFWPVSATYVDMHYGPAPGE